MTAKSLHIAWLGAGPGQRDSGGVPGVSTELLLGLAGLGHRIDCFFPSTGHALPERIADAERLTFNWGTSEWRWDRWYNRTKIGAFVGGLFARAVGSVRLREQLIRRHALEPYDLVYQFSNIEALAVPASLTPAVPLVIHPETHIAGELRFLLAERHLALRCQPAYNLAIAAGTMLLRVFVQRRRIRHADLLVCISSVFRDHLVRDYGYPLAKTVVIPNPVRLERFSDIDLDRSIGQPPTVLVLGRISARKGLEDVIAVAKRLRDRGSDARIRVVGGPSLWSDYTKLLEELPVENSEFVGRVAPADIPAELERADVLLQASKYEPFGLTVGEALAAGVPVVTTTAVGAAEQVDPEVLTEVAPGDVDGMVAAVAQLLGRLRTAPSELRTRASAEAERRFAPSLVCQQIALALEQLVERTQAAT